MSDFVQDSNIIFYNYVLNYGTDPNIVRKVAHCFQVAQTCFEIASMKGYDERKRNFCYFQGLFHDTGRFEQWQLYHTYNDHLSIDHGDMSFEILSKMDIPLISDEEKRIISFSCRFNHIAHNKQCRLIIINRHIINFLNH